MNRRTLLICGILAPALYVAIDLMASYRYPGYSYLHQTISELNAFGSPTRTLTIVAGMAIYGLVIAFGAGVWSTADTRRLGVAGAALVLLGVLSLWAVPFASMQVRGVPQGPAHLVSGGFAVLLILSAMVAGSGASGARFRWYTIATVVVFLAFGTWTGMDGPRVAEGLETPWLGVKERISVYSYQLWFAAFALALLGRGQSRSRTEEPRGAWSGAGASV